MVARFVQVVKEVGAQETTSDGRESRAIFIPESIIPKGTMADITMCTGDGCPAKEICKRYTAKVSEYQSWFSEPPIKDGKCGMFWGEASESIFNTLCEAVVGKKE